ncbi:MAG: hypothetical protein ABFS22_12535, partial [Pseudomonadota bacterium]
GYGYAPYGYGVPVAPAVEMTDEQKQAIADQQAKAAEFYANNPNPIAEMERDMIEQRNADMQEMHTRMQEMQAEMQKNIQESMQYRGAPAFDRASIDAERDAYLKEAEARREESRKAAEQRRAEAEERFKARRLERTSQARVNTGA